MKIFSQMWSDRAKAHSTKAKECLEKAHLHSKREHAAIVKKSATTRQKPTVKKRKALALIAAGIFGAGAIAASGQQADAHGWRQGYSDDGGAAIAGGIMGFAIGAMAGAAAAQQQQYYAPSYYPQQQPYYAPSYYPQQQECWTERHSWIDNWGRPWHNFEMKCQ